MPFLDFELQPGKSTGIKWLFLKALSLVYTVLVRCWLLLYQLNLKQGYGSAKTVISIGNITVGGTGKTPTISWLLGFLGKKSIETAVLTRGYRAEKSQSVQILNSSTVQTEKRSRFGDEPWLLFKRHPQHSIFIAPDRASAARRAENRADLLLLDDGMQHLKLERNLNIVLIDSMAGIGNGQLLPLGPLREPLSGLQRADIVLYTRTNLGSSAEIREKLTPYLKENVQQFDSVFKADRLVSSLTSQQQDPRILDRKKCLLFSAIGNPRSFEQTIRNLGGDIAGHLVFGDHDHYHPDTVEKLKAFITGTAADYVICTEKDWVKLEGIREEFEEFWYLEINLVPDSGFEDAISQFLKTIPVASRKG